ncbi:hypothetical protein SAMN05216297_11933 [Flavobacterium phragmitis]|uniref:SsrA-binding protein n=2 Tax=Flavobacterium TaxID=237 RepID=A0A1I1XDD9_9FLAO|nr:hypothetical protein SAMN05216297_11933 [Flavobacterium phragmitis]
MHTSNDFVSNTKSFFLYLCRNKSTMYKFLAKLNKILLPSFTKQGLDIAKAKKWQMAIIGYRAFVTKRALGN